MKIKTVKPLEDGSFHINYGEGSVVVFAENEAQAREMLTTSLDHVEPFEKVKQRAVFLLEDRHARFLRDLTGNATIEERDTWQAKALAAEGLLAGTAGDVQKEMLSSEAALTGEDVSELAIKIVTRYSAYQKLIGLAAGLKRKTAAALELCANEEQVSNVLSQADEESKQFSQKWSAGVV